MHPVMTMRRIKIRFMWQGETHYYKCFPLEFSKTLPDELLLANITFDYNVIRVT